MSSRKTSKLFFSKEQRQLIWTMIVLLIMAVVFLFIFSWQLTCLKSLPNLTKKQIFPALFQGEFLSEQNLGVLTNVDDIDELSFLSSANGRRFAYILKNNNSQQLVLDEEVGPIFSAISFMAFSPDSNNFAYIAKRGDKEVAIVNDQMGREYDWISSPHLFSTDSRYFIYKAGEDGKEFLVINEEESRAYDYVYEPMLSSDKNTLFFFARDGDHLWRGEIPLEKID